MAGALNLAPVPRPAPDVRFSRTPDAGADQLPQILDLTYAKALRDRMATLAGEHAIILDAGAVERMSTPCAQVLLAAARAAVSARTSFRIVNASAVFRTALADLGLQPEFSKWMD